MNIEGSHYIMFDKQQKFYRCYFAPRNIGRHKIKFYGKYDNSQSLHELLIYGDRNTDYEFSSGPVVKFSLDVTKLQQPMKFPVIYANFHTRKCATDVNVTVDSQWLKSEGYTDPILRRKITVGSKDVTIYAKYGEQSNYDELIKYTVQ
ncbi:unnamed protein product [Rotaria sp. Silwood1]|nr:unnamed protein product [Rotaria sp. Silwood1]CAF4759368.1 unnamed protein product [Rotaria sp. Silwood1]CAF4862052.1 unnamed protein product [Rotaria sp. Silwood1]CAF4951525.1 unnamed protein product [Rotaria sp. Silwood1]